jgi:hypothetical protein
MWGTDESKVNWPAQAKRWLERASFDSHMWPTEGHMWATFLLLAQAGALVFHPEVFAFDAHDAAHLVEA